VFAEPLSQYAGVLPRIWPFGSLGTAALAAAKELVALEHKDANDRGYCDNNWHKKKDQYDDAPQSCIAGFLRRFSVVIGLSPYWLRGYRGFLSLVALIYTETHTAVLTVHEFFIDNRFGREDISRSAVRATQSEFVVLI